jgi:predicted RNA-binding protein YlxR (DUF448 family)
MKLPQRTCVGCLKRDSKQHMLRIAVCGNTLILDEAARLPGRGAYLHCRDRCITDFVDRKKNQLRSLRRQFTRDERRNLVELIHARLASTAALE